ncbi:MULTISPECIES: bifunctional demethylmenaquinone methyltransferase/2-methoxy-6-polyprenyl-1,4-benzoquinol methylase UbiE [Nitrosomonas]|jgi:demethylmenaquinone methyltransferase/2-methoxy-6-polyprenyl-1,4-benzoquinol methylase|uniref:Ubiquinone/menaquinone biosynthesis C-methyltransferase UbiE n=1 Tax=Nitrosomonas communis TaxID=44574 RepID=A0A0F7KE37_9PROT|nr:MULTISPECIES: bifunctional demethylmenaquinone methyltransferase/2-methoxy-6-polyprenyl-1,4-benzoquinol methylase UbiE [Nitrosomonas]AKH37097.1 ubiquinone biosynthesis methyltransferase UbiE [Nitrosomonas communis]TYP94587.1 demethylmenaquinone methyltransferase/2-methoxy-6-polyprenyl-1,4-benzoquinol methylase [Nitrosomonas communis]UVS62261.1 bifunctional demethylmenaquinone methyltransferase/2-methoxy-6-polyprenyl-1,4-benzoquinol methylase UbiE [Nitrosomonas sp. PLL12]
MTKTTHFGFKTISEAEKAHKVADVFDSVAARYNLMNDVMSLGLHRLWKRFAVETSGVKAGDRILDIAGGTADLTALFVEQVGETGQVWLTDINNSMLTIGRDRMLNEGIAVPVAQCDAEKLPFPDNFFDHVNVAFGLRNMTHKDIALKEMLRVLNPGGSLTVLEFSKVWKPLQPFYDTYSFKVLPLMGKLIARDEGSYRYLAESIRMHPSQDELKQLMQQVGFERVEYFNLAAGVVALHRGYKF